MHNNWLVPEQCWFFIWLLGLNSSFSVVLRTRYFFTREHVLVLQRNAFWILKNCYAVIIFLDIITVEHFFLMVSFSVWFTVKCVIIGYPFIVLLLNYFVWIRVLACVVAASCLVCFVIYCITQCNTAVTMNVINKYKNQ